MNVNGTKGHFITKEVEVNQGHSKTKTYRPNDLPGYNRFNKNDQNIYLDSQVTNVDQIPSLVLQPPLYTSSDPSFPFNISRSKNTSSYDRDHRNLTHNKPNFSPSATPEDVAGSGNINF